MKKSIFLTFIFSLSLIFSNLHSEINKLNLSMIIGGIILTVSNLHSIGNRQKAIERIERERKAVEEVNLTKIQDAKDKAKVNKLDLLLLTTGTTGVLTGIYRIFLHEKINFLFNKIKGLKNETFNIFSYNFKFKFN